MSLYRGSRIDGIFTAPGKMAYQANVNLFNDGIRIGGWPLLHFLVFIMINWSDLLTNMAHNATLYSLYMPIYMPSKCDFSFYGHEKYVSQTPLCHLSVAKKRFVLRGFAFSVLMAYESTFTGAINLWPPVVIQKKHPNIFTIVKSCQVLILAHSITILASFTQGSPSPPSILLADGSNLGRRHRGVSASSREWTYQTGYKTSICFCFRLGMIKKMKNIMIQSVILFLKNWWYNNHNNDTNWYRDTNGYNPLAQIFG